MEIDLGEELAITVKMGAQSYKLREPTMDDVEKMADVDTTDVKASNKAIQDFIVSLGMPEQAVKSLGVMRTKKLVEGLTSSFNEKK